MITGQFHADLVAKRSIWPLRTSLAPAAEAESLGFGMLLPVEHHFVDCAMVPDHAQLLAQIAARTSRITLMPAVFSLPWSDPLRVVEKAVMLDHPSYGGGDNAAL